MNILSTDAGVSACLQQHAGNIQYCLPAPSWNPHSVGSLSEFRVSYLYELVPYNKTCNATTDVCVDAACGLASKLLPIKDMMHLDGVDTPETAWRNSASHNVGVSDLAEFARQLFPLPPDELRTGALVDWWINATTEDAASVDRFLEHVSRECWYEYCRSQYISIGNPDIVGYGMFVSTIILMGLTIIFSALVFEPISKRVRLIQQHAHFGGDLVKPRCNFRLSLVSTLPNFVDATLVFAGSVMVSSYVYRWTTHSRFDALVADALSMLSTTAATIACASYWATITHRHHRPRGYVTVGIAILAVLNIVLFSTHFSIFYKPGLAIERLCSRKDAVMTPEQRFHRSDDFYYLFGGFAFWVLTCIGTGLHHPLVQRYRAKNGVLHASWVVAEALPSIAGVISLCIYSRYYWIMRSIMEDVYGHAFAAATTKWGFGQYLALATWLPPVLQFLYYYWVKRSRPTTWRPSGEDKPTDSQEMQDQ